jgi:hypothetical protein
LRRAREKEDVVTRTTDRYQYSKRERNMLLNRWISALAMALLCVVAAEAQQGVGKEATGQKPGVSSGTINVKVSEYWLGVHCRPVDELLRSQFGIAESQGLVVNLVVPDSPAEAAGIRRHDILLSVGGKPLSEVIDVIKVVKAAKGTELKFDVIRAGKRDTITVKPTKRPRHVVSATNRKTDQQKADWDIIQGWLQKVEPGELGEGPRRFRFIRPGTILPPGTQLRPAMPGNLRVTITKQSNKPATIVVQRGEDTWTVTEDNMHKLPDSIRLHVEPLLVQRAPKLIGHMEPMHGHERLETRMDEMLKRIDRLHRLVEELSHEHSPRKQPKTETPE